jgi:hypothetical protein
MFVSFPLSWWHTVHWPGLGVGLGWGFGLGLGAPDLGVGLGRVECGVGLGPPESDACARKEHTPNPNPITSSTTELPFTNRLITHRLLEIMISFFINLEFPEYKPKAPPEIEPTAYFGFDSFNYNYYYWRIPAIR